MSYYRRKFKQEMLPQRSRLRRFLTRLEKAAPPRLDELAEETDAEVWSEVACLSCSNCCRNMTPTFTFRDMQRIAGHLGMTIKAFKEKWLYKDKSGEWMNTKTPCQFLDLKTNMCTIYEVRPDDCAGFPHLTKKKMVEYIHVHHQNVQHCPATFTFVKKLIAKIGTLTK